MQKDEYLQDLWEYWQDVWEWNPNGANEIVNRLFSEEEANGFLDELRRGENRIPKDLTGEELAKFWNDKVLVTYEWVILPNGGRCVPRWGAMTDEQIARVINNANTWEDVWDLCGFVIECKLEEDFDEEYAPKKIEDAIMRWVESNL